MFSFKIIAISAGFIAALALTSFLTNEHAARRGESDRQKLAVALADARSANSRARAAEHRARLESIRGDSAAARATQFAAQSKKNAADAAEAWARFEESVDLDELLSGTATSCDSVCVAHARAARVADAAALAFSDSALVSERSAAARYKLGLDQAVASLAELRAATTKVDDAAKPLTKRPGRLRALLPVVGAGVAAGLDLSGKPNVVTGVTFGWKF